MKKLRKSSWLHRHLYPALGGLTIRACAQTVRVEYEDPHGFLDTPERRPGIIAFWHRHLFLMPVLYRQRLYPRPLTALISPSRDGNLITEVARRFGVSAARGSSSKQASSGLRELIRVVQEEGSDVIITPDGPRGPRDEFQLGALYVAQATSAPIVPVDCVYTSAWRLRSWDRFVVPKPFSAVKVRIHAPVEVSTNLDEAQLRSLRTELTARLKGEPPREKSVGEREKLA